MQNKSQFNNRKYMTSQQLMFMGTGSDVGKSLIVAGLCRLFSNQNCHIAPFKSQNMSNNAAIAQIFNLKTQQLEHKMGEIGRAQWLQAKAAKIAPLSIMNPILLKPESQIGSQVIINGEKFKSLKARDYYQYKPKFLSSILACYTALCHQAEFIITEGAGSPAETNLRANDIANMGFAEAANIPVILIGDIDRGGVIASIIGTYEVISSADRARIKGFMINKFRGDVSLFDDAIKLIEQKTGWPCLGILPYFADAHLLPPEDSVALEKPKNLNAKHQKTSLHIVVPHLPHIANFDDLDPLAQQDGVTLTMVKAGQPLPKYADIIILPGSKSTIADLEFIYDQGWDIDIKSHHRHGGKIMGICGGFQMLGRLISDPEMLEGAQKHINGLDLLDIETTIKGKKTTKLVEVTDRLGNPISAYEIHLGQTIGDDLKRPLYKTNYDATKKHQTAPRNLGAMSKDGLVMGSYLHGVFVNDNYRKQFLHELNVATPISNYDQKIEKTLDNLANHIAHYIDIKTLVDISKSKKC